MLIRKQPERIIICVRGGLVQEVRTNNNQSIVDVEVFDVDNMRNTDISTGEDAMTGEEIDKKWKDTIKDTYIIF